MVDAGLDKKDIQRTTGHSTDTMNKHYPLFRAKKEITTCTTSSYL